MLNTLYLPEIREMLAHNDAAGLEDFCNTLHPAATAEYMEGLSAEEAWQVLEHADTATRVAIFGYFPLEKQIEMLSTLPRKAMAHFIADMPSDERVDILEELDSHVVDELLPLIPVAERRDILRLSSYPEGTAGALMTTDFARLRDDMTLAQVHDQFRRWSEEPEALETLYYLYVVDAEDRLRGVVSFRELALQALVHGKNETKIGELIGRNVITINVQAVREEVIETFARYDLVAIPVVDGQYRLLGIVTHDDVIDVVREEAVEDAQRIAAIQPLDEDYLHISLVTLAWKRGIWLTILFFTSLFTAGALDGYATVTQTHLWLVMFIPMIISTGGNTGNQSATLVITAMSSGEVRLTDWVRVIWREVAMGVVLGGFLALMGFFVALFATWNPWNAMVIPMTVLLVVVCGTLLGAALPMLFRRLGLDPALMSNPLVACLSDILGIVIYMSVALWLLGLPTS